jgi:hypothetical protein
MGIFEITDMSELLKSLTSWLLNNGGWIFPLILMVSHFSLKNYVLNKPNGIDLYRSLVSIPIEIKMMSCSFVFAAAITSSSFALTILFISFAYIFALAISIGCYNLIDAGKITKVSGTSGTYLAISFFASLIMLNYSIQLMKFGGSQ